MELPPNLYNWFVRPAWFVNSLFKNTLNEINFNKKSILDFGCGIGSSCVFFDSDKYLGIDNNQKRINYAKRLHSDYNFIYINKPEIPIPENSIDYILVLSVLHHIPKDTLSAYMTEFTKVLKPDGRIYVNEPCYFKGCAFNNLFMKVFDRGKFIQDQDEYFKLFRENKYEIQTHKQYKQLFCYNKLLFSAKSSK